MHDSALTCVLACACKCVFVYINACVFVCLCTCVRACLFVIYGVFWEKITFPL